MTDGIIKTSWNKRICTEPGCTTREHARGLCKNHYNRLPEMKARIARYRQVPEHRKRLRAKHHVRFFQAKYMAGRRGLEWDLTRDQWEDLAAKPCYYCGMKPYDGVQGHWLDRKDNSMGYVSGNVIPCCGWCNKFRGNNVSSDEFKVVMEALIEYRERRDNTHAI